jgi:hypothetical protein
MLKLPLVVPTLVSVASFVLASAHAFANEPAAPIEPPAAPAQAAAVQKRGHRHLPPPSVRFDAEYRLLTLGLTNLPVDELGTRFGQKLWLEQRLKLMGRFQTEDQLFKAEIGGYLFNGQLAGDITTVGATGGRLLFPRNHLDAFRRFEPRRAMLEFLTPAGLFRVGHQTNNWGYGILANSGENTLDFDDQRLGDLVERVAFATKPWRSSSGAARNIVTALAFDLVYRDSNSSLIDGDVGLNAIGSIFYQQQDSFLGFFGVFRHQRDRDGDRINAAALDVHWRIDHHPKAFPIRMHFGVEGVALLGQTSRVRPDARPEGVDLVSMGGLARFGIEDRSQRFGFAVDSGFASGDNDSNDSTLRQHTLHPDFRVGMVLFPEVLGALSARNADRAADPARVGQAPAGTENLPTNGGVQNAFYVWPRVFVRPWPWLTLRVGLLYARTLADFQSPFLTFRAGGVARNPYDGPGDKRDLGYEVQAGVRFSKQMPMGFTVHAGVEWGHLFPGAAFENAAGQRIADVDRVIGRVVLEWRGPN